MENAVDSQESSQEQVLTSETKQPAINQIRLNEYIETLRLEQNLSKALIAGALACIIGAVIWAVITVTTGYQIGYMAIAVGFLVGYSVREMGNGIDTIFGVIGGFFAILGCLLGNFFSIMVMSASAEGIDVLELLTLIDYSLVPEIMMDTFSPMDLLFYGFAVYEGYKFSFRKISEEEILKYSTEKVNTIS